MSSRRHVTRSAAVVAGLVAVLVAVVGAAPASAAHGKGKRQIVLELTARVIELNPVDNPPVGPSTNDETDYRYGEFDAAGRQRGTTVGHLDGLWVRPSDGHLFSLNTETLTLDDGVIRTFGVVDEATTLGGAVATIHAVGVSGKYAGKVGTRQMWVVEFPGVWQSTITLR